MLKISAISFIVLVSHCVARTTLNRRVDFRVKSRLLFLIHIVVVITQRILFLHVSADGNVTNLVVSSGSNVCVASVINRYLK